MKNCFLEENINIFIRHVLISDSSKKINKY